MEFKVIDTKTGKEPTSRAIDTIAKEYGLMENDIDQFFVGEDGSIVLADDCGNIAYCDNERFKAVAFESSTESTESSTESSTDVCISREAAIGIIESWLSCDGYNKSERHIMRALRCVLHDMPSAKPKVNVDALINKIETEFSWSMYDDWANTTSLHDELVDFIREWAEVRNKG